MCVNPLVIIVPAGSTAEEQSKLRLSVWETATNLLLPKLGKYYSRFEPATVAWGQRLDNPFGVVFGRENPALFLYCYSTAKSMQQEMITRHMKPLVDNIAPLAKSETDGLSVYAMAVTGDSAEMGAHIAWHIAMIAGELQPDCGLYFAAEKEAYASDELEGKVLRHIERYALCVVNLVSPLEKE